jgi:chromosomal replication initiation ATPase DnaA
VAGSWAFAARTAVGCRGRDTYWPARFGLALSVDRAQDVLKDVFPQGEQTQISIERIQELVCERFAVTMAELTEA